MTFLRNTWYVAATIDEVGTTPLARTYLDEPVILYRTESGVLMATQQHCPHRFAPLDLGTIVGETIQCPYHGLRFDTTGACSLSPQGGEVPSRARLKVYPVVERHHLIWIWMGDPALADATVIPDLSYLDDTTTFGWFNGYIHVAANYQLVVDNLLDLSHVEFLHPVLASPGWAGRNKVEISQGDTWVTVDNRAENDIMFELIAQMRPDMEKVGTSTHAERWDAPSIVRLVVTYAAGDEKIVIPSCHALTPETATTTHYLIRGGQDMNVNDPGFKAQFREGVLHVFRTEDVPLIEAQQRFLGEDDLMDRQPAILKADAGAVRARRLLAKLIRHESAPAAMPATMIAAE